MADYLLDEVGVREAADLELLRNIDGFASMLGFDVEYGGVSGAVARVVRSCHGRPVIRVRTEDRHKPRARFSIAHEIGHDHVHEADAGSAWCSAADLSSWRPNARRESEANAFAAALLMPQRLVASACDVDEVSLEIPKQIGAEFDVSLTAAALRFSRLCPEPCAVIGTMGGRIDLVAPNRSFWPTLVGHGEPLHEASLAYDFFVGKRMARTQPEAVPAYAWVEDDRVPEGLEIVEHSLHMNNLGRSLSLIWLCEWPDEEEADYDERDEDMPRFR